MFCQDRPLPEQNDAWLAAVQGLKTPKSPCRFSQAGAFWVSSFVERVLRLFGGILLSGVLGFHALQRTSFLCGLDVRRHLFAKVLDISFCSGA